MHILASCFLLLAFHGMGICVFLCIQKLQRVDTGVIALPPPPLASSPASSPASSLPAPLGEIEELENQIAKTKKIAELKRLVAEAQGALEEPSTSRSTWNIPFRN
jgi:uncharacterized iron-regulated membrane protein